ncbi:unnamed protein product, partial [Closterium sp. NIES-64]
MQLPEFIQRHGAKDKREMKAKVVDGEGNPVTFEFTLHERPLPGHETEGDVTACVELSIKYVRAIDKELEWRMRDLELLEGSKFFLTASYVSDDTKRLETFKKWLGQLHKLYHHKLPEETTETLTQTESAPSAAVSQAELAEGPQPTPEQQSEPKKPFEPKPERETAVSPSTTCDLSVGSWVANPSRQPQYTGESCKSLSRAFNCQRNGRVNMRYLQYEWRSPGCRIERFDASAFLEHMRNKVFLVVGDSVSMNFFGALQCLLETATPTKSRDGPLFPGGPRTRALIAPQFNATFLSHASSFLVQSTPSGDRTTASTWTVHLDQVHPNWSPVLPYSDYVVFGTGAWYTIANLKKRHYMVDNKEQPSENRMATMQTALHTVARFTRSINYTGVPMLLTYSPVHEKVRLNSTARELGCSSYMRPVGVEALEGAQWAADAMDARNAQIE